MPTLKITNSHIHIEVTVAQLAETFAALDNHEMLAFLQHAVYTLNGGNKDKFVACDQFCAVVNDGDIDDATVLALACLQRRDQYQLLKEYKPSRLQVPYGVH